MKPSLGLLGAVILASVETTVPGPGGVQCNPESQLCGRVFMLAIGVDDAGGSFQFKFAASDAKGIAERLLRRPDSTGVDTASAATREARLETASRALANATDSTAQFQIALLTNASATRDNVIRAMRQIAAKATRTDIVIFSFSGLSTSLRPPSREMPAKHFLVLQGFEDPRDSVALREKGLGIEELQRWLDNILPSRQLILVEAGETQKLVTDFFTSLLDANQSAGDLSSRNRVIVAPRGFGRETEDGGPLFTAIVQSRFPVYEMVMAARRGRVEAELFRGADSLAGEPGYLRVIYERDILDIVRPLVARAISTTRSSASSEAVAEDQPSRTGGRNYALVVGTDKYQAAKDWSPLVNPSVDAKAVAKEVSENYGFETTLLIDPPRDSIFNWIRTMKGKLGRTPADSSQDQVLVFIAGHGLYDQEWGWGYLVTRDSDPLGEDPLRKTYLKHNDLADWLERIPSKHMLVVLDACFGGAFSDVMRGGASSRNNNIYADANPADFVQEKMKYTSRLYLTSGGKEYVKDGRPGEHSPFAKRFLDALREAAGERRIMTMTRLRERIEGLRPDPRSGEFGPSHQAGGDFLFVPKGAIR